MTRLLFTVALAAGTLGMGLGCKHVAGKCDCTNDPSDAIYPAPNNPYHPTGQSFHTPGVQPTPSAPMGGSGAPGNLPEGPQGGY